MEREIKFRAYFKDKNIMSDWFDLDNYAADQDSEYGDYELSDYPKGNRILMQFTGLLDKSGNEIYEGDIIQIKDVPLVVVKFGEADTYIGFYLETLNNGMKKIAHFNNIVKDIWEVIGNIYENPELLN